MLLTEEREPRWPAILLVEDDGDDVFLFRRALSEASLNCEVRVVGSIFGAKTYLEGERAKGRTCAGPMSDNADKRLPSDTDRNYRTCHDPERAPGCRCLVVFEATTEKRVLIICKNHATARRIAEVLARANFTPLTTTSAPMGLVMALGNAPQVIVCEPEMRGLSGAPLVSLLKHHPVTAGIPVVPITGEAPPGTLALDTDFTDDALLQAVENAMVVPA